MSKKLFSDRRGSISITFIGLVFFLIVLTFFIMEMGAAYENYYDAETILQRACNSAVEANMLDEYRADNILRIDMDGAKADFCGYLESDMPGKYTVTITSLEAVATPPNLTATGTVTFSTVFAQFAFDDVTFEFKVSATNYKVE